MIVAGIASIPSRVLSLQKVLDSISPQVDEVALVLNGYKEIPYFLTQYGNISCEVWDNRNGDAEKFRGVQDFHGYYLAIDDDIIYPKDYVEFMVDKCREYSCPISLAGKRFKYPVASYHRDFKEYYHCLKEVVGDHEVDVVGTGVLCFHTNHINVKLEAFETPNMADVWFALQAREQGVKLMCVAHSANYLQHINHDWTIWRNAPKVGKETEVINKLLLL